MLIKKKVFAKNILIIFSNHMLFFSFFFTVLATTAANSDMAPPDGSIQYETKWPSMVSNILLN